MHFHCRHSGGGFKLIISEAAEEDLHVLPACKGVLLRQPDVNYYSNRTPLADGFILSHLAQNLDYVEELVQNFVQELVDGPANLTKISWMVLLYMFGFKNPRLILQHPVIPRRQRQRDKKRVPGHIWSTVNGLPQDEM